MKSIILPPEWPGAHFYGTEELEAAKRVVNSASPFRFYGPDLQKETDQFEKEFAEFIGAKFCQAVSSGTAALQIALAAMNIGPGDEVLLPGYFWVSTVSAVVRSGAVPGLVDVDDSFSIDPEDLERKISKRTKAVIMVHMGGVIGQVERVAEICRNHNITLLEDCAQATGASQFSKKAGSFGDMAIFSFQLNKNFTAGEGGAIVTDSQDLFNKAFAIHDLGYYRNERGRLDFDNPDGQLWGIGARMNEITAAILREQLRKVPEILSSMRTLKQDLMELLTQTDAIKTRNVKDPAGDGGAFLKMIFNDHSSSIKFLNKLQSSTFTTAEDSLNPVHMKDWGLHIYSNIPSLVHKRSICGHHSVWELSENSWAAERSYSYGRLPVLDSYMDRTVLFCVPSKVSPIERTAIRDAFEQACVYLNQNT